MSRPTPSSPRKTFWQWLEEFPPITVRLQAKLPGMGTKSLAISHREIAITAGLTLTRVIEISESMAWDAITISEARAFTAACRFDPTNPADRERLRHYLYLCRCQQSNQPPHYLRKSPWWETEFRPLIQRLKSQITSSTASEKSASPALKYVA